MYFIALSVTLFIIIAAVHLLAKVRNENLGIFSKLIAYFVLIVALLMLACQLYRGMHRMEKGEKKSRHHKMMMEGEGNIMFKKKFRHGEMKSDCIMMEDGRKCKMTEDGKCVILDGEEEGCCAGMGKWKCSLRKAIRNNLRQSFHHPDRA
jgi:hypothetical protein